MTRRSLFILLSATLLGIVSLAQSIPTKPLDEEQSKLNSRKLELLRQQSSFITDYLLGPGDIIDIQVLDVPELNKQISISQTGEILLPFLAAVKVEGLTIYELQKKLESLLAQTVLQDPHVSVTIKEYRSQPINILGEVARPGTYQLKHFMRLIDVLSLAGGFTPEAGDICTITRMDADAGSVRIEADLRNMLDGRDLSQNIPIEAGDIIHVAKRIIRNFFVLGDVGRPGSYTLPPNKQVRFSEALSTAGGFLKTAKTKDTKLIRVQADGNRVMIPVDIKKIVEGKAPDILIQENDLIFVPNSKTKAFTQSLIGGAASLLNPFIWALIR